MNAREERAIDAAAMLSPALSLLPAPLLARITATTTSTDDLKVSNVPGTPFPVYLTGAEITRMFPFGPLPAAPP